MKRLFILTFIFTLCHLYISAQNTPKRYEIEEIVGSGNNIRIGGRIMTKGDKFNETDKIEWSDKKQALKVSEVKSTGKGVFSLNSKSMKGATTIKEFMTRRENGLHRSSGELELSTMDGFPQKRIAFVVGNSSYLYDRSIPNTSLDACFVTEALQNKGFDVILELNGSKAEFDSDMEWFMKLANSYGDSCVALFYYAGHGIQLEEKDYLVPCDANPAKTTAQSKVECIEINEIVKQMQSQPRLQNLIIIDACRNKKSRGSEYDFMAPATEDGTCVLYSTKSGDWASDGTGSHSVFAEAFVNNIQSEGDTWGKIAEKILFEVRDKVGQTGLPFGIANRNFIFTPYKKNSNPEITAHQNLIESTADNSSQKDNYIIENSNNKTSTSIKTNGGEQTGHLRDPKVPFSIEPFNPIKASDNYAWIDWTLFGIGAVSAVGLLYHGIDQSSIKKDIPKYGYTYDDLYKDERAKGKKDALICRWSLGILLTSYIAHTTHVYSDYKRKYKANKYRVLYYPSISDESANLNLAFTF